MGVILFVLVLLYLSAGFPACQSFHEASIQRRQKSLRQCLTSASNRVAYHSRHNAVDDVADVADGGLKHGSSAGPPFVEDIMTQDSDYFIQITVGTPPQSFNVSLNTYMSGLWLPSSKCPTKTYEICKNHNRYNHKNSSSYEKEGQVAGYAGMVADLAYDIVAVAGQSVANQSFAEVVQYNTSDPYLPYDGIWGLNMNLNQTVFFNDTAILKNMVDQNITESALYGLYYLKNSTSQARAGGLILGGRNASLYAGDLLYINTTLNTAWQFTLDKVLLFGSKMPPLCTEGGCPAVLDTGSRYIVAGHRLMDSLHRYLGATVFAKNYTYQFNCSALEKLRPVYFSVGQSVFQVPWQSYVVKVEGKCLSSFVGVDDLAGTYWYLGDPFFASVYVEFDADNRRVGLGQLLPSTLRKSPLHD